MKATDIIPPATAEKLAQPWPKGTRHKAAKDIAIPLIGNGMPPTAVYQTLRAKFESDVTDKELQDIVEWASRQNITPSGFGASGGHYSHQATHPVKSQVVRSPVEQVNWWLSDFQADADQVIAASAVAIPTEPVEAAKLAFGSLYREPDNINIVCKFILDGEKARPTGAGKILTRDKWLAYFDSCGVPQSDAGGWMRLNPCSPVGSGKDGAVTDADVTAWRYVLIESDTLPLPLQLAFLLRCKLPIAAIILSGASSAHAWVKIEAQTVEDYKKLVAHLFAVLKPFGIDQANSNPSRLCRLPGSIRKIGAINDGAQRLLWLNPNTQPLTDAGITQFEELLKWPAIDDKPLRSIAQNACNRYEELYANRGKLGVPYGVTSLDAVSGGMKPGQTVVVAGATGGGKTTFALHIIKSALNAGYGVALFSLEMDRDEIFDQMVSDRCNINRNKFNNGEFHPDFDFPTMAKEMPAMSTLPLYIEDGALVGVNDIRLRLYQLKADGKIHLAVVDYIQFVNPELSKESREQQVATISHALRALARESRIPMVVLSQLNDDGKLRESRVIAHNANVVLMVEVDKDDVKLKVVKGRGIPCEEYAMRFERMFCRFVEIKPKDQ